MELERAPLTIASATELHLFEVEIAWSAAEQEAGLMGRRAIDLDRGMIFPIVPARPVALWMKDVLVPLDLIFVAPGGAILRIEACAQPGSLAMIASGGEVEAVLEINGGRAAALGISPGDRVDWRR